MRDPYLYLDVDVLINKKNIKDQNQLDKLEEDIIPLRMIALRKQGLIITSVFDIQKIHSFLWILLRKYWYFIIYTESQINYI